MKFINLATGLLLFVLTLSCREAKGPQSYLTLRKEVLAHYKAENNPLKLKAARFLLDNLKSRYAISGERYKMYSDTIKMYRQNRDTLHKKLLSIKKGYYNSVEDFDIYSLTPQYLIDNIDQAFASWDRAGWKGAISFTDFCEYLLPYRLGNEPLENWRKEIASDTIFKITGDTLYSFTDTKKAASWLTKRFAKLKTGFDIKWGADAAGVPDLPYSMLKLLTTGTCANISEMSLFVYRAAGIPIASDFTPHWANNTAGHDWTAIITNTKSYPFSIIGNDTLGRYKSPDYIPAKVYRATFSENSESHVKQRGTCEFLPELFNNPRLLDVTDLYTETSNITVPILTNPGKEKFAYLAVSDREGWVPVTWGRVKRKKARFEKVVRQAVYLPIFVTEEGQQNLNVPFQLLPSGEVRYLSPNHKTLQSIMLTRKYPLRTIITVYTKRMRTGKFQASNNKDFKDAVTLYTIADDPGLYYNEVPVNVTGKFRYVRYAGGRHCQCNVAEIEFYGKNGSIPLKGEAIGTPGDQPIKNAFDGNDLTYFDTRQIEGAWVGLDLGKPTAISKIRFVSRNDKNHIVPGNSYELFYWEDRWKSLGIKTAEDKVLVFDKVPSNCLFYLKNRTAGKEERIFTYENGKQVWW